VKRRTRFNAENEQPATNIDELKARNKRNRRVRRRFQRVYLPATTSPKPTVHVMARTSNPRNHHHACLVLLASPLLPEIH
jgi:hypothetical protein